MLSRNTSVPASISRASMSGDFDAGPTVATVLVRFSRGRRVTQNGESAYSIRDSVIGKQIGRGLDGGRERTLVSGVETTLDRQGVAGSAPICNPNFPECRYLRPRIFHYGIFIVELKAIRTVSGGVEI